ncbi:uncharacterized protein B0T23DRAFT_382563 [Neurospora hispaniola]|uniref:Uncharacterized protein n=1 Tax=Neurospora hispaniola TaxID=588809 RepID=A0AAJ0I5V8_9PEZI|nr:hypothetical protein B0T23DRAFT_382563 [Neurospora hispaniola]
MDIVSVSQHGRLLRCFFPPKLCASRGIASPGCCLTSIASPVWTEVGGGLIKTNGPINDT